MPSPDVTAIIWQGRRVLADHPSIGHDAHGLLRTLGTLSDKERLDARAYLLHVYGLTVGITTPATVELAPWPPAQLVHAPTWDLDDDRTWEEA